MRNRHNVILVHCFFLFRKKMISVQNFLSLNSSSMRIRNTSFLQMIEDSVHCRIVGGHWWKEEKNLFWHQWNYLVLQIFCCCNMRGKHQCETVEQSLGEFGISGCFDAVNQSKPLFFIIYWVWAILFREGNRLCMKLLIVTA